jgi:integrase
MSAEVNMQKGSIKRVGKCWLLRYYEPVLQDGKVVKRPRAKKLATYGDGYRTEKDVRPLADLILAPINARTAEPESSQLVTEFLEYVYMPHARETLKPSTANTYKVMLRLVKPHLGGLQLRETRTSHVDRIIRLIADGKPRAHTTLRNVKSFLSGAFRYAKRTDRIGDNPVRDSLVPRGKPMGKTPAYTLPEVLAIVDVVPEPARTAVLVAAFTGMRVSEIKGLQWDDFVGDELRIVRSVWSGHITDTKTLSSRAPVPVVPILKRALEEHRNRDDGKGYIFHGNTGKPLRLENVVRFAIKPALDKAGIQWLGWHAFRRGVGTNLNGLGVPMKTIQDILRHGNIATTQAFYVKPVAAEAHKAMRKLERAFNKLK